ncbi:predicted protein [Plenodomus lingam JN3]|uniref:Uncharacterized protein n=1 Tax=Leptosphaeria maculans (strain JN3 / isolate v23.1.3 / race Av1-4-5-6-7-8) TaxID=985895 RepID=E4ZGZ5_LEPMJ|nr:predicted protein [Plenodomus lingam JN3]CBX90565.1 predicted protein [Plenodomus lingam JN3]
MSTLGKFLDDCKAAIIEAYDPNIKGTSRDDTLAASDVVSGKKVYRSDVGFASCQHYLSDLRKIQVLTSPKAKDEGRKFRIYIPSNDEAEIKELCMNTFPDHNNELFVQCGHAECTVGNLTGRITIVLRDAIEAEKAFLGL